jgi:hypothetical protein
MKKNFVKVMLLGALAFSTTVSFVGCKDYDDDIDNLQEQIDANKQSIKDVEAAIQAGKFVVSYSAITNGYELTLSDGSNSPLPMVKMVRMVRMEQTDRKGWMEPLSSLNLRFPMTIIGW